MDLAGASERPFPLFTIFLKRVIPVVLVILGMLVAVGGVVETRIARDIYLNLAQLRAQAIVAAAEAEAPAIWHKVMERPLDVMASPQDLTELRMAFAHVSRDSRISYIKIIEPGGRLILGSLPEHTGRLETIPALREAINQASAVAVRKDSDGVPTYEFFVPILGEDGRPRLVLEVYEPAGFLDHILLVNTMPAVMLPTILLSALLVWLAGLFRRAQNDINQRTEALLALRARLERFVSGSAKGAVRGTASGTTLPSRLVDMTLFYSDVVDFTGYSESHPPQRVVDFLNHLMTIQIEEIHRHAGDVDKMIGDAVLACFEGADRAERAVAAAQAILRRLLDEPDLPRTIRIGLHDGYVISGAIGPEERQDFTVIGDSVNVAARLCSAAGHGEVLVDQRTIARAGHPAGFSPVENITVKGRRERLEIRRWSPSPAHEDDLLSV